MTIATKDGGEIPLYSLGAVRPSSAEKLSWTACVDGSLRPHLMPKHQPFNSQGEPWLAETATGRWVAPVETSNPHQVHDDDVVIVDPWGQMVSSDTRAASVRTDQLFEFESLIVPFDQPFHPDGRSYALQVTNRELGFASWVPRPDYPEEKPMALESKPSTVGYSRHGTKLIDWDAVKKPVGWTPSEAVFTDNQEICTEEQTASIETFSKPIPESIPRSAPGCPRAVHFAPSDVSQGHSHAFEPVSSTAAPTMSNLKPKSRKKNKTNTSASSAASRPAFSQARPQVSQPSVASRSAFTLDDIKSMLNTVNRSQPSCNFSQASRPMNSYRPAFSAVA